MIAYSTVACKALTVVLQHLVLSSTRVSNKNNPDAQRKNVEKEWQTFQLQYPWLPSIDCDKNSKFHSINRAVTTAVIDQRMLVNLVPLKREEALIRTKYSHPQLHQQLISSTSDAGDLKLILYSFRQSNQGRTDFEDHVCMMLLDAQYRFLLNNCDVYNLFVELQTALLTLVQIQQKQRKKTQTVIYQLKAFESWIQHCFDNLKMHIEVFMMYSDHITNMRKTINCQTLYPDMEHVVSAEDLLTSLREIQLRTPRLLDNIFQNGNDQLPNIQPILRNLTQLIEKVKHAQIMFSHEGIGGIKKPLLAQISVLTALNDALSESLSLLLYRRSKLYFGHINVSLPYNLMRELSFLTVINRTGVDKDHCRLLRAQYAFCWMHGYSMRLVTDVFRFKLASVLFPNIATRKMSDAKELRAIHNEWSHRIEQISILLMEAYVSGRGINPEIQTASSIPTIRFLRNAINDSICELYETIYYSKLTQVCSNDNSSDLLLSYQQDIASTMLPNYSYLDHIGVGINMSIEIINHYKTLLNQCIHDTLQDAMLSPDIQEAWSFLHDPPLFQYFRNRRIATVLQSTILTQLQYSLASYLGNMIDLFDFLDPTYAPSITPTVQPFMFSKNAIEVLRYTIERVQHGVECINDDGSETTTELFAYAWHIDVLIGRLFAWIYSSIYTHLKVYEWKDELLALETSLQELINLWKDSHVNKQSCKATTVKVVYDSIIMKLLALSLQLAVSNDDMPCNDNSGSWYYTATVIRRLWGNDNTIETESKFIQANMVQAFVCTELISCHNELCTIFVSKCDQHYTVHTLLSCYQQWQRTALELMHLYIEDKDVDIAFTRRPSSTMRFLTDQMFAFTDPSSPFIELVSKAVTILTPCKSYITKCVANQLCWSDAIQDDILTKDVRWLMQSMSEHKTYCEEMMQNEAVERRRKYIQAVNSNV